MKDFSLVVVEWLDHTEPADPTWTSSPYPDARIATAFTAGWIIRQNDLELVMVPHICYSDDEMAWSSPIIIAKGAIMRTWKIKDLPDPE